MKNRPYRTVKFAATAGLIAASAFALAQEAPDVIFVDGKVVTVDTDFSMAEAVAVTGNQISGVGSSAEIRAMAGAETRVIDLDGKTLIPGLIDNHNHLLFNSPT